MITKKYSHENREITTTLMLLKAYSKVLEKQKIESKLLIQIFNIQVSEFSIFSDDIWEYPANLDGLKNEKINWQKKHVPENIILELKFIFLWITLDPLYFFYKRNKCKYNLPKFL